MSLVTGDVRIMHRKPQNTGALFQVASQFNMLEMVGPTVTPDQGVTIYQNDFTQGPACAIAAGAATIWRNYFVPIGDAFGQTWKRQLNGLTDVGAALSEELCVPAKQLWKMCNGYALPDRAGLDLVNRYLRSLDNAGFDDLRAKLSIGLHWDVEATESEDYPRPLVSQAFCSALPVAYSGFTTRSWEPSALLVLEAAYEATLWSAVLNAQRGTSNVVFLTFLGGGAFGNEETWIETALLCAAYIVADYDLDVRLVSYGRPSPAMTRVIDTFR